MENGIRTFPVWIVAEDEASDKSLGLVNDPWGDSVRWAAFDWSERMRPDLSTSTLYGSLVELIGTRDAMCLNYLKHFGDG